jgi:hypothetical protein
LAEPNIDKHLEFIQAIISRQAHNSFVIKGWTVTLCTVLVAFAAHQEDLKFAVVLLIPAIAFWCLDGYYLRQERLFRFLYDDVRAGKVEPFGLGTDKYRPTCRWTDAMAAPSVIGLHPIIIAVAELVIFAAAID